MAFVRQGTQGPTDNRRGDYFTVTGFAPNNLGWAATGTSMQGCCGAGCKETRYVIFGRERDLRGVQKSYNPIFRTFTLLIVRLGRFSVKRNARRLAKPTMP